MSLITDIMGKFQGSPMKIVNFQDMQTVLNDMKSKQKSGYLLINVLSPQQQSCLIENTLSIEAEEETINDFVENYNTHLVKIILYGKNCSDYSILEKKNKQLVSLGFNTFVYLGGLFEWLLLQDIYGCENFPTSRRILDILMFSYPSNKLLTESR